MRTMLLFAALLPLAAAHAEVYRWVDDEGVVHFSDEPRRGGGSERIEIRDVNTAESVTVESAGDEGTGAAAPVVMYSAEWCGYCDRAREYFRNEGIAFEEFDVEASRRGRRYMERSGIRSVPVIVVGDQRMVGFSADRFERLYRP